MDLLTAGRWLPWDGVGRAPVPERKTARCPAISAFDGLNSGGVQRNDFTGLQSFLHFAKDNPTRDNDRPLFESLLILDEDESLAGSVNTGPEATARTFSADRDGIPRSRVMLDGPGINVFDGDARRKTLNAILDHRLGDIRSESLQ